MASHAQPYRPFPRGALCAAALLIGITFLAAGAGRLSGSVSSPPTAAPVASRDLHFEDRADGAVAILDARTGKLLEIAQPGTNGFLRATLRGLARERKHQAYDDIVPFRLTGWADGRLTLEDPTTHRTVELEAFGQTNAEVFGRLLPLQGKTP
jgi:putative photosynthetic complex assembly protein